MNVLVYGTLKRGGALNRALSSSTFLGEETTPPEYTMAKLGWFPGVRREGDTPIQGEVFEIDDETLQQLDRVEGYPTLYTRELIDTSFGRAWIYLYNSEFTSSHSLIDDGNWPIEQAGEV